MSKIFQYQIIVMSILVNCELKFPHQTNHKSEKIKWKLIDFIY